MMNAPIPLNDLARLHRPIRAELERAVARVLDSGQFLTGGETEAFEEEWADHCGQKYCVSCASGTDALTLAALGLQLAQAGVQANTLPQTAIGLSRGGARVSIIGITGEGHAAVERPDAVPVLLYGRLPSASETGQLLFDAAQAHGWRPPGHATACWSFYPAKTLGALGDGGAVTTNDGNAADRMRDLRSRDDRFRDGGQISSRLDEIQAAVLRVKLKYLPSWIEERREIADLYRAGLPPMVQPVATEKEDLQHLFVVRTGQRDALKDYLGAHGVQTKIHYPEPLHLLDGPWTRPSHPLPEAEHWSQSVLSLPCFPGLGRAEIKRVTDLLAAFFEKGAP